MPKIHKINKKNHFGDVLTNMFYHGDVLTNFWARFDQFGDVLTRGRFDCNLVVVIPENLVLAEIISRFMLVCTGSVTKLFVKMKRMLESRNNRLSALLGLSCREENAKANFAEIFDFHSRCSNGRSRF